MTQVLFDPLFLQLLVHKYRLHTIHYEAIEQYMYNAGNLCLQFISPMKSSPTEAERMAGSVMQALGQGKLQDLQRSSETWCDRKTSPRRAL